MLKGKNGGDSCQAFGFTKVITLKDNRRTFKVPWSKYSQGKCNSYFSAENLTAITFDHFVEVLCFVVLGSKSVMTESMSESP